HSGGSAGGAMDSGSRASMSFTGTGVSLILYRDEWSGIANVYLDGALKAAVDPYASPFQPQATAYTLSGLSAGTHTVVVEATQTHNPSSGGSWVWVDAFELTSERSSGRGGATTGAAATTTGAAGTT